MKTRSLLYNTAIILLSFSCSGQDVLPGESKKKEIDEINIEGSYDYLALGDSYTIGESVNPNYRFPVQLAKKLREKGQASKARKTVLSYKTKN